MGNGVSTVVTNKIDGREDVFDGVRASMVAGGLAGGLAAPSGKLVGELLKNAGPAA